MLFRSSFLAVDDKDSLRKLNAAYAKGGPTGAEMCIRDSSCAEGVPTASLLQNQKKMLSEINAGYGRKGRCV